MRLRVLSLLVVFMLACSVAFAGAEALREAAYERYLGIWVSGGVAVEIGQEGGAIRCRAVFPDGGDESEIREYAACYYEEAEDALQCFGVTRTRERFDSLLDSIEELDWSTDDMRFAELRLSGEDLLFTDDELDAPVALTRLSEAEDSPRNRALAFAGLWADKSSTLRVEDHGACYRFTVTVPMDGGTRRRWSYTCLCDPDGGRMASVNVSPRTVVTRETDGTVVETEEDSVPGGAEFTLDDEDRLVWRDLTDGKETTFARVTD